MKKLIAKVLNATRDRRSARKETTEIVIGEAYLVKHKYKRNFYITVKSVNDTWVVGHAMDAEFQEDVEERIIMRELCSFTKLGDENK
jgi:hypothetical protein